MMVKPISHYGVCRNDSVRREPSGKLRRSGAREHMVYVVRQDGSARAKVGRTHNAALRIQTYETASGVPVRFVLQIIVPDRETAKALEREMIAVFSGHFASFKREWFAANDRDVERASREALGKTKLSVTSVRGLPAQDGIDDSYDPVRAVTSEIYLSMSGRRRR